MKNTLLKKYFISYLILLLAVFMALTAVFASLFAFAREQVQTTVRGHFERIGNDFEEQIRSLRSTADLMQTNEHLTRFRLSAGDYMSYNGIKELRKIRSFNGELIDVFLYFQEDVLYSAKGKYELDVYLHKTLQLSPADAQNVQARLTSLRDDQFYPLVSHHAASPTSLLYLVPLRSSGKVIGCVGFQYSLSSRAAYRPDSAVINLQMKTPEGLLVLETTGSARQARSFPDALNASPIRYEHITPLYGFYLEATVDPAQAFGGLYRVRNASFLTMSVVLAAAVALSYFFSQRHYRPIKLLSNKALSRMQGVERQGGNEFDAILHVLDREGLQNEALSEKVSEITQLVRQQALRLLFSGGFQSEEQAYSLLRRGEIALTQPYYTVFFVLPEEPPENTARLEALLGPLCEGCCPIPVVDTPALACIASLTQTDGGRRERRQLAQRIAKALPVPVRIFFGQVYTEPVDISRCYAEAMVCAEQSRLSPTRMSPLFFETLTHSRDTNHLPDEHHTAELLCAIENRDADRITTALQALMRTLCEDTPESSFRRVVLQYQLYQYCIEHGAEPQGILAVRADEPEMFAARIERWIRKAFPCAQEEGGERVIEDIIEYLEKNYPDPDLDLVTIAARFHISPNYISRFFKQHTGKAYTHYLADLRLNEAHRLLLTTALPIYEIVQRVGYLDAVSFTKKFKRAFGHTPSALRQQSQPSPSQQLKKEDDG